MSHCSTRHSNEHGLTLVELVVVVAILAVIVASLCDVFIANQMAWDRQSAASTALITTSAALSTVGAYLENAVDVKVKTRYTTGDAVVVCLPQDSAYGIYVPQAGFYRQGQVVVFYLSDSTGSYSRSGDILWAGTLLRWVDPSPGNVTPDPNWSLYPGGTNGRIAPVTSLQFTILGDRYWGGTLTVTASYKAGRGTATLARTRNVCYRYQGY